MFLKKRKEKKRKEKKNYYKYIIINLLQQIT